MLSSRRTGGDKKTRHAVSALHRGQLQIYEDNVAQEISSFSQDTLPLSVVLLFDLTDSVRPVLKSLGEGALKPCSILKPEDEVAVMVLCGLEPVAAGFNHGPRSGCGRHRKKASNMKSDEAAFSMKASSRQVPILPRERTRPAAA